MFTRNKFKINSKERLKKNLGMEELLGKIRKGKLK